MSKKSTYIKEDSQSIPLDVSFQMTSEQDRLT